jgi:hypothetical protein
MAGIWSQRDISMEGAVSHSAPPPAEGVRQLWDAIPPTTRAAVEALLGSPVVSAVSQPGGFSPGVAARLLLEDGRRAFVKAACPTPNRDTPVMHRHEARNTAALPPGTPVPRLLFTYDEGPEGWIALAFEDIDGRPPAQPWCKDELDRVLAAMVELSESLTPSPVPETLVGDASVLMARLAGWALLRDGTSTIRANLDPWAQRHLDKLVDLDIAAGPASAGDTLLHMDIRADNILLTPERVWFVDWPHCRIGAAWVDLLCFAPSVTMQGGPELDYMLASNPACRRADPAHITAVLAVLTGYFFHRSLLPPSPGLPTVRAFQAAQGMVSLRWLKQRTGWG